MAIQMNSINNWQNDLEWKVLAKQAYMTDDELTYLRKLADLRSKKRESETLKSEGHTYPSVIIDGFLYQGSLQHANDISLLNKLNIRHIVNVSDCSLEQDISDNFNVLWIKIEDCSTVDIAYYFDKTNQFLNSCKTKSEKVLVHCQMGVSRSSTIVLAYLIKYHHDSLADAFDCLVERRRCVDPNQGFLLQLIRYEHEIRKKI